jgi:glycosyltransferase involved in cell wall biosynthesis
MVIVQLADAMISIGGISRFIHELTLKLSDQEHKSITVVYELDGNNKWGDQSFDSIKLDGNDEMDYKKISDYSPDLIVWHVSGKSNGLVRELSKNYPILAIVHSLPCPSGTRLFRDKDEICNISSGARCLQYWYTRRCGIGPSPVKAFESLTLHKSMMKTLKSCKWVYTISNTMKFYLMQEGINEEQITIFDVSLGGLKVPEIIKPVEKNNNEPTHILFVGRLSYVKGVQYLIKAIKVLSDEGMKIQCSIVGDGWYKEKLLQIRTELKLQEVVTFVGSVPGVDIGIWYKASDVVVVPSIYPEPAGLVVPEARSYGKPVVVFNVGGLAEWKDYMSGISLAKSTTPNDLAQAIKQSVNLDVNSNNVNYVNDRIDLVEDISNRLRHITI